ncbi:MAG: hypothetical protein KUG77_15500 [Nannocystaceae bacterium]|nr:hypothetical protein [Nannocystaceae bacterium]
MPTLQEHGRLSLTAVREQSRHELEPPDLPVITTLLEALLRAAAPSRLRWMRLLVRVLRVEIPVRTRRHVRISN